MKVAASQRPHRRCRAGGNPAGAHIVIPRPETLAGALIRCRWAPSSSLPSRRKPCWRPYRVPAEAGTWLAPLSSLPRRREPGALVVPRRREARWRPCRRCRGGGNRWRPYRRCRGGGKLAGALIVVPAPAGTWLAPLSSLPRRREARWRPYRRTRGGGKLAGALIVVPAEAGSSLVPLSSFPRRREPRWRPHRRSRAGGNPAGALIVVPAEAGTSLAGVAISPFTGVAS